jgi:hypothetical protein
MIKRIKQQHAVYNGKIYRVTLTDVLTSDLIEYNKPYKGGMLVANNKDLKTPGFLDIIKILLFGKHL